MKFASALLSFLAIATLGSAAPSPRPGRDGGDNDRSSSSHSHTRTRTRGSGPRTSSSEDSMMPTTSSASSTQTSASCADGVTSSATSTSTSEAAKSTSKTGSGSAGEADAVGALYFTTNNPDTNNIIVGSISSNGNVTFAHAVSTQGKGEHNNDGGRTGADATFSNNLLVVHDSKRLLATANTKSNTVVLFEIDAKDATKLTMLGAPVDSEGDYPSSLAFNAAGDKLCVMNAGERATIFCYDVAEEGLQPQASSLRDIPGYNQTARVPYGPSNTASAISFTEDGSALVVAVKGTLSPPSPGFLAAWPVESDGSLAQNPTVIENVDGKGLSFSLTPVPGRNAFVSADFASAVDVFDFSGPLADVSAREGTTSVDIDGELSLCWSTYSAGVDRYYLAAPPSALVVEVELDEKLKPTVIARHTVVEGSANVDLVAANVKGNNFIFTLLTNTLGVAVLSIDGPGQTSLVGVTDLKDVLADAGAPIRPNYMQGLAVYIKP
ncbi:unnamed protein product [Peniophora sp. CBMAI 1063]|nr:unnamed protein product [Peniophora sp. CBMAI 1063]